MKALSIDYGTKNIGLALSDDEGRIAFAYATINQQPTTSNKQQTIDKVIEDIKKICELEKVETVVVGMPLGLSGRDTEKTKEVWGFVKNLQENLKIPVETEDERLTTVAAGHLENKNARNIDELSAQILLQGFLDRQNSYLPLNKGESVPRTRDRRGSIRR
ncbi:MAG: Holliday junction resolvase RuvX [Patescibacteria group bacterium]|nr:Holliday junction resolvase RuvX [Patescibacteria group bacterium]